jgi:hypothetical protein
VSSIRYAKNYLNRITRRLLEMRFQEAEYNRGIQKDKEEKARG